MTIFIFGNPDLASDALTLRILPELKKRFPHIIFEVKDPQEEWDIPEELVMIDTIVGIEKVSIVTDIKKLIPPPTISLHDFDVASYLHYCKKLGKLKKIKIIGIPPTILETEALPAVEEIIVSSILP